MVDSRAFEAGVLKTRVCRSARSRQHRQTPNQFSTRECAPLEACQKIGNDSVHADLLSLERRSSRQVYTAGGSFCAAAVLQQDGALCSRRSAPDKARPTSEDELQRELDDARIERCRNRPEVRGAEYGVAGAEVRRLQQIEDLRADLERCTGVNGYAANEREIDGPIRRPADRIPRRRANGELRRDGEGRRVEPLAGCAL